MLNFKTLCLVALMPLLFSICQAQEVKKVSKKTNVCGANFKENFTVLKSDPELRHGSYTAEIAWVSEKGQYEQGKKTGVWEYFSDGKLVQKFDFATGKFLKDTLSKVIQKITTMDENGTSLKELDPKGIYLGGDPKLVCFISRCLRYPKDAMENNIQGKIKLSALLTKDGKLTELKAVSNLGGGLEQEGIRVFQLIPQDWVPVVIDGKSVDVIIELGCNFTLADR